MSALASKKGKIARGTGCGTSTMMNSGLLDAYMDGSPKEDQLTANSTNSTHTQKPISKKNKNKKKREAREAAAAAASGSSGQSEEPPRPRKESERSVTAGEEEEDEGTVEGDVDPADGGVEEAVVDSWEDIQDAEAADVAPPPPQFVIDASAVEELKKREEEDLAKRIANVTINSPKDTGLVSGQAVLQAAEDLRKTIQEIGDIFSKSSLESGKASYAHQKSPSPVAVLCNEEKGEAAVEVRSEKTKEEIKAEREAKKRAKMAVKALAKTEGKQECTKEVKSHGEPNGRLPPLGEPRKSPKSKGELKAERRAKQDAQRAAKASSHKHNDIDGHEKKSSAAPSSGAGSRTLTSKVVSASLTKYRVPDDIQADRTSVQKKTEKQMASKQLPSRPKAQRKVMLFSHLRQYERDFTISKSFPVVGSHIHPAVLELGLQYAEGTLLGSNARCLALLNVLKRVISDYQTPPDRDLARDLDSSLSTCITFLKSCRNHSVSMGNGIRFIKTKISSLPVDCPQDKAKRHLCESIDNFVSLIELAAVQISNFACEKIRDGDVILVYGCSSLLREVFVKAVDRGLRFTVIVADSRPRYEGREMLQRLLDAGVRCSYISISCVSFIMSEVSKVFLGAHAVLANGSLMSRIGNSVIAVMAKARNVPVLVCCETYKFIERVQTDSFVFNELGDPDDIIPTGADVTVLEDWRDLSSLKLLNMSYDVTPANLIDAIISEISVIPCTSVAVVLRLKSTDYYQ